MSSKGLMVPGHCAAHQTTHTRLQRVAEAVTVALVGQPNVGKSTVFNMLTGLSQHVGNWPGKTVEQKVGTYEQDGTTIHIIDLPGTYSLTANSEEERIARNFLITERPDVVMVVLNAAALERNLYLVAELLSLSQPVVIGLNMLDVAEQQGMTVEPHVLEAALGVPVVPLVATKNQGVRRLAEAALQMARHPETFSPERPWVGPEHAPVLAAVQALISGHTPDPYPEEWLALKLLEGDAEITELMERDLPAETWKQLQALLLEHEDAYLDIAGGRYEWIGRMVRAAVVRPRAGAITLTDRIDRIATHPVAGLITLLAMFGLVFWLTYALATPIVDFLGARVLEPLTQLMAGVLAGGPAWLSGLVVEGFFGGVGTVLTFLPILVIFFAALGVLEDVGYLARAAYVMDRFMHLMGLHGKSFLPLFLGFGCNVPAVLGTRIIEEKRTRLLTVMLAPLVPCTARMAVVAFLAPAFFGSLAPVVSFGLVAGNMLVLAAAGVIVNRVVHHGAHTAFIMEIPLYHRPNLRTIGLYVWNNTVGFIQKAGTLILIASAAIWALSNWPGASVEQSVLAMAGRALEPLGQFMGLGDWRMIVALLTSFVAKENVIASLGILYGGAVGVSGLATEVAVSLTPAARLAFLVVHMLFIPCLATTATIRQETGSWRWTTLLLLGLLAVSLVIGAVVYQIVRLGIG